jgi:hypothetical protein
MKTTNIDNASQDAIDSNCLVDTAGMPIPIIIDDQINEEQPSDDDPGDTQGS